MRVHVIFINCLIEMSFIFQLSTSNTILFPQIWLKGRYLGCRRDHVHTVMWISTFSQVSVTVSPFCKKALSVSLEKVPWKKNGLD